MSLLRIRNLTVEFATASGAFRAVDGVDQDVDVGEILAIVGESGSGKSVSMLALMGLLPWTAKITADELVFNGHDLTKISPKERRKIIGKDLAMIFQEPMSSLNPCFTVGWQIKEALRIHMGLNRKARHNRAIELFEQVGIPDPERRLSVRLQSTAGGYTRWPLRSSPVGSSRPTFGVGTPTADVQDRGYRHVQTVQSHDCGVLCDLIPCECAVLL